MNRWRRLRAQIADDEGSTMLLTIAMGAFALALILVVAAATSLAIERRQLFTVADGASLSAAETFVLAEMASSGAPSPTLTDSRLLDAATQWVAAHGDETITVVQATSLDNQSATVTLRTHWAPPVLVWVLPEGIPIDVTVTSRSVFGQ